MGDDDDDDRPDNASAPSPPRSPRPLSGPEVTLVAASELHEAQRWAPTPSHPGPALKTVEWSADGTAVITSTASKSILSYVLPADLLDRRGADGLRHNVLQPQGRLRFGITPSALAPAPYFSLAESWSQCVLAGFHDRPIQLYPLFPGDDEDDDDDDHPESIHPTHTPPIASYPLVKPETEAFLAPLALLWPVPGTHFVAGARSLIALFDVSRTANDPPLLRVPTATVARPGAGYALGLRGNVSALALPEARDGAPAAHSLTAAGTWTRGVGLFDLTRAGGQCVSHWKMQDKGAGGGVDSGADSDADSNSDAAGDGVVQLLWSPCGRYLVVNERKSRGLAVYDVRGTGRRLCTLAGRPARVAQPVRCGVYGGSGGSGGRDSGFEVWSGTNSGEVVVYDHVGAREGDTVYPAWRWQAHSARSMVGGVAMHSSGSVLATCSSSPAVHGYDDSSGSESEEESDSDSNSDDEDSSDDSDHSSSPSASSTSGRQNTGKLESSISDPSLKIWSLVPLATS